MVSWLLINTVFRTEPEEVGTVEGEGKTLSLAPSNFRKLIVKNTSSKNLLGRRKWNRGDNPFSRFNPSTRIGPFCRFDFVPRGGGGEVHWVRCNEKSESGWTTGTDGRDYSAVRAASPILIEWISKQTSLIWIQFAEIAPFEEEVSSAHVRWCVYCTIRPTAMQELLFLILINGWEGREVELGESFTTK